VRIGVPRETRPGETRVAATPKTVEVIRGLGYAVFVEQGAGALSSFDDAAYLWDVNETPDGQTSDKTLVVTIERVAGGGREGRPIITKISGL